MQQTRRAQLWNRGFLALFVTQFFEAASDNILKVLLTFTVADHGPWAGRFGTAGQGVVGAAFMLPFILLSAFAGRIADRYPKNRTTLVLKLASLVVAALTAWSFRGDSAWIALLAFIAFATVSAFFGPVKYGMITELVGPDHVVRANGIINMGTNVAVIAGSVVAGFLATHYRVAATEGGDQLGLWLPGIVMGGCVLGALAACLFLPRLRAQVPDLDLDPNPLKTYLSALRDMSRSPLLGVAFAWTYFYFLAAMILLMLPDYAALLGVTEDKASYLMAIVGVTIGVGCVAAAYLCGKRPNPRFVTAGAISMAVAFLALGLLPLAYVPIAFFLGVMGLVAGLYIIPLQSMLQIFSPDGERGRFLGTANALSFVLGLGGAGLFSLLKYAGMPSNRMFLVLAASTAVVGAVCFPWGRTLRRELMARGDGDTLPLP